MKGNRWRQIEDVCQAALERTPDEREPFLDAACAGDEDLRREVESLLAEPENSDGFLSAPLPEAAAEPLTSAARPSLVGRTLTHYRIDALLRAGGMGEVYRATDTTLGRVVAIKVLTSRHAVGRGSLARFEREARALAELNHPNILTVHEVGTDDGTPFVVTEFLEGKTLRDLLSQGAPTRSQVVSCVLQAARGLAAAHRQGLIHRDLKPENLFLTTDGRVKILDFGLARHAAASGRGRHGPHDSTVTEAGVRVGTVAYMSPEQVNAQPLDARSDIFSLGVVLYELLARTHPFRRDTIGATLQAIVQETPPDLPSTGDPAVPPSLAAVVRRCLKKDRDERFENADDLLQALEGTQRGPAAPTSLDQIEERGPYPGLLAFSEDDAAVFFGREAEVEALWARIERQSLLAIIGSSGAGKTSFVRAGVVPGRPDGWAAIVCTPGRAPMRSLGRALAPELVGDLDALRQLVSFEDTAVAFDLLRRWRRRHLGALLVVDQFEELFALNPTDVQARFAAFLGRLAAEADIRVVVSLRDDFFIRCCEQPPLAPVLTELTALLPLRPDALRRALAEPASALGYRFEDEALLDEIVASVTGTRAALPMLAFAVSQLWERRDRERRVLTREGYQQIGGVAGALAQHAEATLDRVGAGREQVVREMFRNLVTADGTRTVVGRDELLSVGPDRDVAGGVLQELLDARLLTSYDTGGLGGHTAHHVVEIAHESLLRAWPRLVRWQNQDEGSAQMRDHLRQASRLWHEAGRSADRLWTGTAFREFALWRERYGAPLTPVEDAFAAAMAARAKRMKRLRTAAVAAVIVGLGAVAIAIGASRRDAVASARRAEASKLVALGRLELDRYPTAAVAYARASLELSDTTEARLLAIEALWRGPTARILTLPEAAACSRVAFSAAGDALACAGFSDKVVMWTDAGDAVRTFAGLPTTADTRSVAFDNSGQRLFSWLPGDTSFRSWSPRSGAVTTLDASAEWVVQIGPETIATLGPARSGGRERVLRRWSLDKGTAEDVARWTPPPGLRLDQPGLRPVSVAPTLRWIAFGDDRDVVIRDLGTRAAPERRFERHEARIREVRFDRRAERLLSLDETGLFCLWSVPGGELLRELQTVPPHRYSAPEFSPDGSQVSWTAGDGTTHLWNLLTSVDDPPLLLRRTDLRDPGDESFDPQGRWLATAGWGSVAFWPIRLPHVSALSGHVEGPVQDLEFSPDSRLLASCARDGALLWSVDAAGGRVRRVGLDGDYYCYGLGFASDGRTLALNAPYMGTYLVPLDGGAARRLVDFRGERSAPMPLAFDAVGRTLAVAPMYATTDANMRLRVVDISSGLQREFPLRTDGSPDGYSSGVHYLKYLADGQLLMAGANGIRRWDPASGAIDRVLWGNRFAAVDTDKSGGTVVALLGTLAANRLRLLGPELVVLDGRGRRLRTITTHGNVLMPTIAVDDEGDVVVTGDANGIVRVGSIDGREPHLLVGHAGPVNRVAISPDGRWIASASGQEIRLWPMPDLTKPVLHTQPRAELIAKLLSLTNLRVVQDPGSATGWTVQVGPFPGWKQAPTW